MCGILGLARARGAAPVSARSVMQATEIVRHRGPDDEGYVLWTDGTTPRRFAGPDTTTASRRAYALDDLPLHADWRVALGHRRLSVVDLSAAGHQPMVHAETGLAVCYNGEIYNHLELRAELEQLGHRFRSASDTEVLLHAWLQWGTDCLQRLNGMFAFMLLDPREPATLHAVRDRFGVKPLYVSRVGGLLAFASEIKQIRALPGFAHRLDEDMARDYLAYGLMDHTARTLDAGVSQLRGGERASLRLDDPALTLDVRRWYDLPASAPIRSRRDAAEQLRHLLDDSVRLRLRADVPLGSCLSGGLDSSAIVCLAHRALRDANGGAGQMTVTACFEDERFDEWRFAQQVARGTGASAVRVWPSIERLQAELDVQLWHLDEPVGSTSQFSQWCVFDGAADAGLKVMLDGQGSDEQLAGYAGSDAPLYAGMLRRGALGSMAVEVASFRRRNGHLPMGQLLIAARSAMPGIDAFLPKRLAPRVMAPSWLIAPDAMRRSDPSRDLASHLRRQLLDTSLPLLLRYEDRNSMAWSVESRVPFLDFRLVEFLAAQPDAFKSHRGVAKVLLRDAMRGVVPNAILDRRDKMGFVTPEQRWLTQDATQWFRSGVDLALDAAPDLLRREPVHAMMDAMIAGSMPFTFEPWRILCFGRWLTSIAASFVRPTAEPVNAGALA